MIKQNFNKILTFIIAESIVEDIIFGIAFVAFLVKVY